MKTLFSIIFSFFIAGAGIVLAMNAPQDDARCRNVTETAYTYDGPNAEPSLPLDPSEPGLSEPLVYNTDFTCENSDEVCHYVYENPSINNPDGRWIKCSGTYLPK